MKKVLIFFLAIVSAVILGGCSSDSGTNAGTNSGYHIVFKYIAAVSLSDGSYEVREGAYKFDLEFKNNSTVHYSADAGDGASSYEIPYIYEKDEEGDDVYTMTKSGGNTTIKFYPNPSDAHGPVLVTISYDQNTVGILTTSKDDVRKFFEAFYGSK